MGVTGWPVRARRDWRPSGCRAQLGRGRRATRLRRRRRRHVDRVRDRADRRGAERARGGSPSELNLEAVDKYKHESRHVRPPSRPGLPPLKSPGWIGNVSSRCTTFAPPRRRSALARHGLRVRVKLRPQQAVKALQQELGRRKRSQRTARRPRPQDEQRRESGCRRTRAAARTTGGAVRGDGAARARRRGREPGHQS